MSIQHTTRVIFKGIWRDMKSYQRYKAYFLGGVLNLVSMLLGFLIIGGAYYFTPEVLALTGLEANDIFIFMLTGTIVQLFSSIATWAPLNRVEEDIHFGTLEAIFVTPSTRLGYLVSTTISDSIVSIVFFIPIYIITLAIVNMLTNWYAIGFTLLVAVITIISNIAVGMFFGMLGIMFRQTRLLVSVTSQLMQFLCGAYIPVQGFIVLNQGFGTAMKYIAFVFPFTYNFDLFRHFMFGDRYITLLPMWLEFVLIGAGTILFVLLARFTLIFVERKAKKQGLAIL
ncbi:MAG: ABC transporter permease [Asgard group archaeon]|nr:ABC transporter permease [Asgard group archaeon]